MTERIEIFSKPLKFLINRKLSKTPRNEPTILATSPQLSEFTIGDQRLPLARNKCKKVATSWIFWKFWKEIKEKHSRNLSPGSGLAGSDQRASRDGGWSHCIANTTIKSNTNANTNTKTLRDGHIASQTQLTLPQIQMQIQMQIQIKIHTNTNTKALRDGHTALQAQLTLPCAQVKYKYK